MATVFSSALEDKDLASLPKKQRAKRNVTSSRWGLVVSRVVVRDDEVTLVRPNSASKTLGGVTSSRPSFGAKSKKRKRWNRPGCTVPISRGRDDPSLEKRHDDGISPDTMSPGNWPWIATLLAIFLSLPPFSTYIS